MKKIVMLIILSLFTLSSFAGEYRVKKVKTLGPMKTKVIFQSKDLKKVKQSNVLKGKLVAQWGTQVFEVVQGLYACDSKKYCKLTDYERVATFQNCQVKSARKVECRRRLDGGNSGNDVSSNEVVIYDNPDSTEDDFHRNRNNDSEADFPVRVSGEFDDMF